MELPRRDDGVAVDDLGGVSTRGVVRFYNGRGTAEQRIKEGKNAICWTRLSRHAFRHNAVRLQLLALAYNLGDFLRTLALPGHWTFCVGPPGG